METAQILLKDGARLRLNEGACLPLRSDFGRCRACATACPAKVIQVEVEQVSLADGCLNCGRCVAACPTDALQLEGYGTPFELAAGTAPVEVECAKVPLRERAPGAVEVPCLGALSVGRVAELHEMAGPRGVALVDRGWCGHCSAGCGEHEHPAAQVREQLVLWLGAIGDPRPAPKWVYRPLSLERLPRDIPVPAAPPDEGPAVTRRQFFRTVAQDPIGRRRKGSPMGESGRAAFPISHRREAPDRRRLLQALDAAAERAGALVPAEFFPRVTASAACADHRVCTAACPTGALKVAAHDGAASLIHAATACIACGACQRACPEGALALEPHGGERAPAVIARHQEQICTACGDTFAPRADETVCLACSKTKRFIGDAMSQLFATKN
jgi:Fe-S-cluster-containing hydrogenase component 2